MTFTGTLLALLLSFAVANPALATAGGPQVPPVPLRLDEVIEDSRHTPDFHRRKDKYWVRRARQVLGKSGRS